MEKKILKIAFSGIKNIKEKVEVDFSSSLVGNTLKVTNVKGIFGVNGTGKTAFISAVDIYKNICLNKNYLVQDKTRQQLDKLINYNSNIFDFEIIYMLIFAKKKRLIFKHHLEIKKEDGEYIVNKEEISYLNGRSLSEQFVEAIGIKKGVFTTAFDAEYLISNMNKNRSVVSLNKEMFDAHKKEDRVVFKKNETWILNTLFCVFNIKTFLLDADKHQSYFASYDLNVAKYISNIINKGTTKKENALIEKDLASIKKILEYEIQDFLPGNDLIERKDLPNYKEHIKHLKEFINVFKPCLTEILIDEKEHGDFIVTKKKFVYCDCKKPIDYEFESAGIKNLIALFDILEDCAKGDIVFIDEMDTNINSVYLNKLIEFFVKYGNGQMCFTSHNMDTIDLLKSKKKAISFFGIDGTIETWSKKGNKNPKNSFVNGYIENSPMNIEHFDFLTVFNHVR